MTASHQSSPLRRLWTRAQEYLTHWFIAGLILTLTGFTPDHWVERLFHALKLDGILGSLPAVDYRLLAVGIGVAVSTCALIFQNRRGRKEQLAAAMAPTATPAPGTSPLIEDLDDIAHKPSIAVLPFVNMSDDKSQEYLADGMTEDIITGLSCDGRLFVIARNSTFAYKGQSPDIRAVGKELGVRYVLEGSIRPLNDRLRISVQLIETGSGVHVWTDKIDRPVAEIFAIMDDVVDGLVTALCSNLGVAEAKRAARQRPEDLQAWALCVQAEARYYLQPSAESRVAAEKLARQAAEIEPSYGVSWALLALLASLRIPLLVSADPTKDRDEALALAKKAMSLAPHDPSILGYCGGAFVWAGQAAQAIDCLERSLEINPNSGLFRELYGFALFADGRPEAGIVQLKLFLRLSPKDPNAGVAYAFCSLCYLVLDDFRQAEEASRKTVKLLPGSGFGYVNLAMSLTALGRAAEAQQVMQKARQIAPLWTPQGEDDFWRVVIRKPEQAEKIAALIHQVGKE